MSFSKALDPLFYVCVILNISSKGGLNATSMPRLILNAASITVRRVWGRCVGVGGVRGGGGAVVGRRGEEETEEVSGGTYG